MNETMKPWNSTIEACALPEPVKVQQFTLHTVVGKLYIYNCETQKYVKIARKTEKGWKSTHIDKSWTNETACRRMLNLLNSGVRPNSIAI